MLLHPVEKSSASPVFAIPNRSARFPWYLWAALAAWATLAVWTSGGGTADIEIETYLPYHLSKAPLAKQIYNSRILDQGMFQARELSYALDALDCRFITWSARLGFPHFLSLVYFLCMLATALLLWRFLTSDLDLDRAAAFLLVALYLTTPCVFLSTSYFRSAKAALTLAVMILTTQLWRGLRTNDGARARWILFGLVAFAATLCDRQGFFLVLVIAGLLAAYYVLLPTRAAAVASLAALAAVGLSLVYNYALAPRLTLALNGYWPDFSYQHLPWQYLRANPAGYVLAGLGLLLDTVRFTFGDFPAPLAIPLLAAIVIAIAKRHGRLCAAFVCAFLLCLVAMNALMTLRHPALLWEDVRRVYYWLPVTLLAVALAAIALAGVFRRANPIAMRLALAAALAANIAALPHHRAILRAGHSHERLAFSAALRRALVTGRPTPEVAVDPIYQALR
jgi:hypothetical protein